MTLVILYAGTSDRNYDTMRTDERTTVSGLRLFEDVWCALRILPARRRDQLLKFAMVGEISRLHSSRVNERYRPDYVNYRCRVAKSTTRRAPLFERFDRGVHRFSPELEALDLRNLRPR